MGGTLRHRPRRNYRRPPTHHKKHSPWLLPHSECRAAARGSITDPFVYTPAISGSTLTGAGAVGADGVSGSRLISSLSSLPGLKYGTFFGGTSTLSPVFGF